MSFESFDITQARSAFQKFKQLNTGQNVGDLLTNRESAAEAVARMRYSLDKESDTFTTTEKTELAKFANFISTAANNAALWAEVEKMDGTEGDGLNLNDTGLTQIAERGDGVGNKRIDSLDITKGLNANNTSAVFATVSNDANLDLAFKGRKNSYSTQERIFQIMDQEGITGDLTITDALRLANKYIDLGDTATGITFATFAFGSSTKDGKIGFAGGESTLSRARLSAIAQNGKVSVTTNGVTTEEFRFNSTAFKSVDPNYTQVSFTRDGLTAAYEQAKNAGKIYDYSVINKSASSGTPPATTPGTPPATTPGTPPATQPAPAPVFDQEAFFNRFMSFLNPIITLLTSFVNRPQTPPNYYQQPYQPPQNNQNSFQSLLARLFGGGGGGGYFG